MYGKMLNSSYFYSIYPMKIQQELALVLNRYCVKNINVISPDQGGNGDLVDNFYNLLQDEPDLDKDEIARRLYGKDSTEKDNRFRKLKQRLTRRMANTVFFIDPKDNQFTDLQKAYYLANREYALAKILTGRRAAAAADHFMRKVYKRSRKYELTDLLLLSTAFLRGQYAYRLEFRSQYTHFRDEYLRARKLYNQENDIQMAYEEVVVGYGVSAEARKETLALVDESLEYLHTTYPEMEYTYRVIINYFALRCLSHELRGDVPGLLVTLEEGLRLVENKPYTANVPRSYFYLNKMIVYIIQKDYPNGSTTSASAFALLKPGRANWYKFKELEFLLAMHTAHYAEALAVYHSVAEFSSLSSTPKRYQDRWLLNRAYIYYLEAVGKLDFGDAKDPWGKFRLNKFLNNVPAFSRDKKGMNIPVLILQIVYSIALKRFALTVDRIEAIEKYRSRHIKRDESYRANLFVRILLQFPIVAFHSNGVRRKTEKDLKLLHDNPIDLANQSLEMEILPYETIYELALEGLSTKFQHRAMAKKSR
jgi:hypothetical protein